MISESQKASTFVTLRHLSTVRIPMSPMPRILAGARPEGWSPEYFPMSAFQIESRF